MSMSSEKSTNPPFLDHFFGDVCCLIFKVYAFSVPHVSAVTVAACLGEPLCGWAVLSQKALAF